MISKHKLSFEFIPKKVLDKLDDDKLKSDLYKYRRVRRKVLEWEDDVDELKNEIDKKKKRIKEYNKIITHLYNKINVLRSDFLPIVNVVNYKKGKTYYWNINVKFKNQIKSIYLGSDNKIREIFKNKIGLRKNVSKDKLKQNIEFHIVDEIMDMVIENKDDFSNWSLNKEELWKLVE